MSRAETPVHIETSSQFLFDTCQNLSIDFYNKMNFNIKKREAPKPSNVFQNIKPSQEDGNKKRKSEDQLRLDKAMELEVLLALFIVQKEATESAEREEWGKSLSLFNQVT